VRPEQGMGIKCVLVYMHKQLCMDMDIWVLVHVYEHLPFENNLMSMDGKNVEKVQAIRKHFFTE